MKKIFNLLLEEATNKYDVAFCDIRHKSMEEESINTSDDILKRYNHTESIGVGIRVLKNGRWGFASTNKLSQKNLHLTLKKAVLISEAAQNTGKQGIQLTKEIAHQKNFKGKFKIDPFKLSPDEKINILFDLDRQAKKNSLIKRTSGSIFFLKHKQLIMNTEGSDLHSEYIISSGNFEVQAVDESGFQSRLIQERPKMAGFEWIKHHFNQYDIERVCDEAVMKLKSKIIPRGKKDLIILPSNLMLTMHESVGHPTELDRVLGWEANFAGTSFATVDKLGHFQYGSDIVNFHADNTFNGGLSSRGWDDDGVLSKKWEIIKNGKLVNYGTTREVAHYINQNKSKGCNFASTWRYQPINRIPNLFLAPRKNPYTLKNLISDTDDGLIVDGRDSFSIDQRRYNFQFGGNFVREVKNGKIGDVVKDFNYRSISPEFWNSCDQICDERFFEYWGTLFCGKGMPMQLHSMTHGSAPARFRNITVGD